MVIVSLKGFSVVHYLLLFLGMAILWYLALLFQQLSSLITLQSFLFQFGVIFIPLLLSEDIHIIPAAFVSFCYVPYNVITFFMLLF